MLIEMEFKQSVSQTSYHGWMKISIYISPTSYLGWMKISIYILATTYLTQRVTIIHYELK